MSGAWNPDLVAWAVEELRTQGFDLTGIAAAPAAEDATGNVTAERFTEWVQRGRAGEMHYLKRTNAAGELLRRSARVAMPWARSVVVCALNYNAEQPRSLDAASAAAGWIARYAWMGDEQGRAVEYHDELMQRIREVEAGLRARTGCETRAYVDTGPVLERDFAARAGLGWVGKNTCVINQQQGSWLLLGVIVTSLEMAQAASAALAPDRCGSCTRCIDACPTDALIAPRQMDASLCIAYLTIEHKGAITPELREKMGRQIFGCDICQEVCPWNRQAPVVVKAGLAARTELVNPGLEWLAALDQAAFKREFGGSPLERTRRSRLHRNVAIAMGNSGQAEFVPRLEAWAAGEDAVLAESARWALAQLGRSSGTALVGSGQDAAVLQISED